MKKIKFEEYFKSSDIILIVVTTFALILNYFVRYQLIYNYSSFNSDVSSANLLALEQLKNHDLFPKTWIYGQDIQTLCTSLPIVFLNLFMKDQLLMKFISNSIFILIICIFMIVFSKKYLKNNSFLIFMPLIFCTYSNIYYDTNFVDLIYFISILYILFAFILIKCAFTDKLEVKSKVAFYCICVFIGYLGINGVRNVHLFDIPFLVALIFVYSYYNLDLKIEISLKAHMNIIKKASCFLVSIVIGTLFFILVKSHVHYVKGTAAIIYTDLVNSQNNINGIINPILNHFGYSSGVSFFSILSIKNLLIIIFVLILYVFVPYKSIKIFKKENVFIQLFIAYSLTYIVLNLFIMIFSNVVQAPRYFNSSSILLIILLSYYIYSYIFDVFKALKIIIVICMSLMIGISGFQQCSIKSTLDNQSYITNFLQSKGLYYGYATYWNAYNNTVISNLKVKISAINLISANDLQPFYWLCSISNFDPQNYIGKTFLMLTDKEIEILNINEFNKKVGNCVESYDFQGFHIFVYDYNIAEKAWVFNNTPQ